MIFVRGMGIYYSVILLYTMCLTYLEQIYPMIYIVSIKITKLFQIYLQSYTNKRYPFYKVLSLHYCQLTKNEYSDVVSLMVNRLMFRTWCSIYIPTSTKYFIFLFSFILLEINIFCFVCKMEKCVRT